MRIICVVKYVPDVDNFKYDFENNTLIRENVRLLLNPDDVCAVSAALKIKEILPDTTVEVVTMAPKSVQPFIEDLIRVGADKGTIISDRVFAGSDTFATSKVLGKYLSTQEFELLLSGTHAIDGDTSHVPPQIAEILDLNQLSHVIAIDFKSIKNSQIVIDVENENAVTTYAMELPAVVSMSRDSKYKMPYVKRGDMDKDVSEQLFYIDNEMLGFDINEVGIKGSPTKVAATYNKQFEVRHQKVLKNDDEGIETVYQFLVEKGFL